LKLISIFQYWIAERNHTEGQARILKAPGSSPVFMTLLDEMRDSDWLFDYLTMLFQLQRLYDVEWNEKVIMSNE
jgi:hypothetical protein